MSIRILNQHISLRLLLLIALEALVAVAALAIVAGPWWDLSAGMPAIGWGLYVAFAMTFGLALAAMGLYSPRLREGLAGLALRILVAALAAWLLMWLVDLAAHIPGIVSVEIALALGIASIVNLLVRYVLFRLAGEGFLKSRVLVYGAGWQARSVAGLRRRTDRVGFEVMGFVPSESDRGSPEGLNILEAGNDLLAFCRRNRIDEIVVAMDDRRRAFPVRDLLLCRIYGIEVIELMSFLERETGKVRLDVLNPSWMIFSDGFRRTGVRNLVSRLLDILASLALLAVAWPIMIATMLAIKIEDGLRAPVLYRQTRIGQDGRPFQTLKFRSMRTDAEEDGIARWAVEGDGRVTRVGAVIRKLRIDELPQLLNILRGDMRFVGPRPERPEFVEALADSIPYYSERHCVKPGLTGWAQLRHAYGSSEQDAVEKLQYDLYYIKNRTLLFDLAILLQTVEVVIFGKGAR